MAYLYGSGNETVDRMTYFGITGNVTPHAWFKTILKDTGRPHLLAIELLADIVYWYRPQEVRDEQTGHLLRYQKKFSGEMLQKSYDAYAEFFGEKKRIIKEAMDVLVRLGVVKRQFRTVKTPMATYSSVMFLDLDVEKLHALTYPEENPVVDNLSTKTTGKQEKEENLSESYPQVDNPDARKTAENKAFPKISNEGDPWVRKIVPPPTENRTPRYEKPYPPIRITVSPGTKIRTPYTENRGENTGESTTERMSRHHHDDSAHTREQLAKQLENRLRKQIGYEELSQEFFYAGKALEDALKKIAEAMAEEKDLVVINGKQYPYSLANMRFASATEKTFRAALSDIKVGVDRKDEMVNKLFSAPLHYPSK